MHVNRNKVLENVFIASSEVFTYTIGRNAIWTVKMKQISLVILESFRFHYQPSYIQNK